MNKYWSEACPQCKDYLPEAYPRCECTLRLRIRRWWRRTRLKHWWNEWNSEYELPPLPTPEEMDTAARANEDLMAIMERAWDELNPHRIGPGDGGPCPECGEDMRGKFYDEQSVFNTPGVTQRLAGRYWHMKYEHGILENYRSLRGRIVE